LVITTQMVTDCQISFTVRKRIKFPTKHVQKYPPQFLPTLPCKMQTYKNDTNCAEITL